MTEANHKLELLASLNGLTGLANRRRFDEDLATEWQRCLRGSFPLSFILIDVDFFKAYNDTYGHILGDECLKKIARILQDASQRATDLAARYGGEEFVIVLPHTPQPGVVELARNIQNASLRRRQYKSKERQARASEAFPFRRILAITEPVEKNFWGFCVH